MGHFYFVGTHTSLWEREHTKRIQVTSRDIPFYYIDTSVLVKNTPIVKFIRNYTRDSNGVFSISSILVRISMLSLISSLSLQLYLNSLVHDRNIFGSSLKVFGNRWQSSIISGNFQKMISKVRVTFEQFF